MTGEEALANFNPASFDLALLDIQLPDMTGFDVAQELRSRYSEVPPLVALTANVLKDKQEYLTNGMDDAISKPLSVKALTEVINKCHGDDTLQEPQPEEKEVETNINSEVFNRLLDLDMLESYVDIVGSAPVLDSITMFEQMMPDYIDILDSNMTAKDQPGIASEAHKIKGAAGSIGLKRIQSIAQKAQSPELPAWWENIEDWVEEIKNEYQNDIQILKSWLESRESK
jgi:two-component system aerobic respiration control sensor histidine kinase ArcB